MSDSIQDLVDSFGDSNATLERKGETVLRLRAVGAAAINALISALAVPKIATMQSEDQRADSIRMYAARTLGMIGKPAANAAPALADLFAKSRVALVRREAALALARIGPVQDAAINGDVLYLMTSALHSADEYGYEDVRESAAIALGAFGPLAKNAVPQLLSCLMDRSSRIRDAAFQAVLKIGAGAVPHLMDAIRDRARLRADFVEKGTIVLGTWAVSFGPAPSHSEKRQVERQWLEKIFESGVQILAKLAPSLLEFRTLLNDIVRADTNSKLQTLAKEALEKLKPSFGN